jgi:hypothetical protein
MSSTDNTEEIESKIKALFEGVVLCNTHENYLMTVHNKNLETYYEEPKHPGQAYFSFIDTNSVESLAEYFNDFWMELGSEEFTLMVGELSELAFQLSADPQSQSDDISPFVYAMY